MSTASEMQDKVETRPGQTTQVESASDTEMADAVESGETQEPPTDNNSQALAHTTAKDRTLQEFLGMMDQYAPIIPDAVTDYYLGLAGFECDDPRIKRLLALAAQKFIADIAQDAYQYSKIRASTGPAGGGAMPAQPKGRHSKDRGRAVLTMDDLGSAVHEYGINLKRQDFMR